MVRKAALKPTPSMPISGLVEKEVGQLVDRFEKSLDDKAAAAAATMKVNPVDLLDASTRGVLVLFPYTPETTEAGVVYPVMKGNIDSRNTKVQVSAFLKKTDEGREYLSLSIGSKGHTQIGGALFRQEAQSEVDGRWSFVPGKENERFGIIQKSTKIENGDFETVFELKFTGKCMMSGAGVPYIKANVYPVRVPGQESAGATSLMGCF